MDAPFLVFYISVHVCLACVLGTTFALYSFPVFVRARTVPYIFVAHLAVCYILLHFAGSSTVAVNIFQKSFEHYWIPNIHPAIYVSKMLKKYLGFNTILASIVYYFHWVREPAPNRILLWQEAIEAMLVIWTHAIYYALLEYVGKFAKP